MRLVLVFLVCWFSTIHATPSDFVVDAEVFRHGTTDRTWKSQAIYMDEDSSLLLPYTEGLLAVERKQIQHIYSLYSGEMKKRMRFRVYIHPVAKWGDVQSFVTWLRSQKLEHLELRTAELREGIMKH